MSAKSRATLLLRSGRLLESSNQRQLEGAARSIYCGSRLIGSGASVRMVGGTRGPFPPLSTTEIEDEPPGAVKPGAVKQMDALILCQDAAIVQKKTLIRWHLT